MPFRIKVPTITDLSSEELAAWTELSKHPLLDGELIENVTPGASTTTVYHGLGRTYRGFIDVLGLGLAVDSSNSNKQSTIIFTTTGITDNFSVWVF